MVKKIYFDPGHEGTEPGLDPGAVGNGLAEAELNLKIVNYAVEYLEKNYTGHETRQSRKGNKKLPLSARDDAPDAWGADVFISVHINAGGGTGFESHIYTNASTASTALQNVLHAEIFAAMKPFGDIKDRGKKRSNFFVVRETNAPAILTENLFVDTTADAKKLANEDFVKAVGQAHGRGVAKFLGLKEKVVEAPKQDPKARKKVSLTSEWYYEDSPALKEVVKLLESKKLNYTIKEVK